MKDRIKQLMESQHLSQQNFADKIQISPASLSSIFNDRTKPTLNHVDAIVKGFPGINLQWLLYGQGEMFTSPGQNPSQNEPLGGSQPAEESLFLDFDSSSTPQHQPAAQYQQQSHQRQVAGMNMMMKPEREVVKIIDKPQRQITEIRIYYDDHTWETFTSKK